MNPAIQPNAWVALQLPSGNVKCLQISPNSTISLGKYGSFPSNLLIDRPYHLTYELQDKIPGEQFSRLRVVSASELYEDVLAEEAPPTSSARDSVEPDESDRIISAQDGVEYSLVDVDNDAVIARSTYEAIDDSARQTLTTEEIEELKREGTGAGRDLIAKLMLSHTALDHKTAFSLAKYKLLKTKKYIRRFSVVPLDIPTLGNWLLDTREYGSKILDMREELTALLGCWANVHYGGEERFCEEPTTNGEHPPEVRIPEMEDMDGGRYLVVDDTGGFLIAAMAERMGILHPRGKASTTTADANANANGAVVAEEVDKRTLDSAELDNPAPTDANQVQGPKQDVSATTTSPNAHRQRFTPRQDDFHVPYSLTNTITVLHANSQPNFTYLGYFGFDLSKLKQSPHPLNEHLLPLTWLQLLDPDQDTVYPSTPPSVSNEILGSWKANRRGNYHRKRRRWARTRHIVDSTRAGGFSGFVAAATMDPVSILRHVLPLLAGGAPIAIYSAAIEPLAILADCFSVARRTAWTGMNTSLEMVGKSAEELDRWEGSEDFPINPTLVLGASIQTSRARKWQVLPGRTHPLMTARGGPEGYIFTGWRAVPAEGRIAPRGKFKRRKTGHQTTAVVETGSSDRRSESPLKH